MVRGWGNGGRKGHRGEGEWAGGWVGRGRVDGEDVGNREITWHGPVQGIDEGERDYNGRVIKLTVPACIYDK
jgi:hypothetical protein